MAWTYPKAKARINELKKSVPDVTVERFADEYLPRYRRIVEAASAAGQRPGAPLSNLSNRQAVLVDAVHVYANLMNFDDFLLENATETEKSHRLALQFLHLHYGACDRAVEEAGAQRVDFHGQRLHAVVVEPAGEANRAERVRRALGLAQSMQDLSILANSTFGLGFAARYRIGIDCGPCIALKSGRGTEPEPLYVGHSANYAAKLADGPEAGIFVSDTVEQILSGIVPTRAVRTLRKLEERATFDATAITRSASRPMRDSAALMEEWQTDIFNKRATRPETFAFHYHQPPLRGIDYAKLMPSNSIRMPLLSIFADLSGYTAYVAQAMKTPVGAANAVRNLHVIRGEMSAVLREDFDGKKVRFIGDCIHGVFAVGNANATDAEETVSVGVHLAGAIRSSFDICKGDLTEIGGLGLAIGLELGDTPISRIGIRGDRSVRVAVSKATAESEARQSTSDGRTTAIGSKALAAGSSAVRRLFSAGSVRDLDYDTATMQIPIGSAAPAMPAVAGSSGFKSHFDI